jgi:hypothetical protein
VPRPLPSGDCESGGRARERGAAGQHAQALPMQTLGQEGPGRADAPRPKGSVANAIESCGSKTGAAAASEPAGLSLQRLPGCIDTSSLRLAERGCS